MAHKTPIITCVKGRYQPQDPNTFKCTPAAALIISSEGEVEIFSKNKKCNQKVVKFSGFGGEGRSLDLLDDQLILLGEEHLGGRFEYKSIHQPRKGLLGMKLSLEASPLLFSRHSSFAWGNHLLAIGGDSQSKAKLSNSVWWRSNLRWQNGSQFNRLSTGACRVKMEKDVFFLIGGFEEVNGIRVEMSTVLRLNVTEGIVTEFPAMNTSRAFHACEVTGQRILISGGVQDDRIPADEVYNVETKTSHVLEVTSSLGRQQHSLLRIEDTIFAFGGLLSNKSATNSVIWFDWNETKWKLHDHSLISEHTGSLAVTPFPLSSVDCHTGCSCGRRNIPENARIIGGSPSQVVQ